MRSLSAVLAVLAVLAGCSSEASSGAGKPGDDPVSRPSASTTVPAPTTTTRPALTMDQAARRYLQIVKPYNVALEKLEKAFNGGDSLPNLRKLATEVRKATETEMRRLRDTKWPSSVRAPMKALTDGIAASLPDWRRVEQADSHAAMVDAIGDAEGKGAEAAAEVRSKLELDKYDEGNYQEGQS